MIIWSRLGVLVAVFVFGFSLIANLLTDHYTGSEDYWNVHNWPLGVSLLVSGLLSWAVGSWLASAKTKTFIDKETGEEIAVSPSHTLFFIKMHWWGPILLAIGVALIVLDVMK